MPIYPGRRRGTFRIVVWSHGKAHEEIAAGSRADALEHEARMRIDLAAASTRRRRRIAPVFSVFSAEEYAPHARAHLGADTWRRCRQYVVSTLREHFGPLRLDAISALDVAAYVKARTTRAVRPNVVNAELKVLRTMLRFARELGHPVAELKIRSLPSPTRRVHCWSPAEVARLCAAARREDPALLPLVLFLLNTGARKGESVAALWSWVDRARRTLRIGPYDGWSPKSRRPREVPVSDALARTLRSLPRSSAWIFPTRRGGRRVIFPGARFRAVVGAAGLTGGPHTCRHTFASLYLAAGGSLHELSALLGHSTTRTTELYAHLMPDHLERARNVVNIDGTMATTMAKRRAV